MIPSVSSFSQSCMSNLSTNNRPVRNFQSGDNVTSPHFPEQNLRFQGLAVTSHSETHPETHRDQFAPSLSFGHSDAKKSGGFLKVAALTAALLGPTAALAHDWGHHHGGYEGGHHEHGYNFWHGHGNRDWDDHPHHQSPPSRRFSHHQNWNQGGHSLDWNPPQEVIIIQRPIPQQYYPQCVTVPGSFNFQIGRYGSGVSITPPTTVCQ